MRKEASAESRCLFQVSDYFKDSSTATATLTVMLTMGERWERRRWREKHLRLVIVGSITLDCRNGQADPMSEAFL